MRKIILFAAILGAIAIGGIFVVHALSGSTISVILNEVPSSYIKTSTKDSLALDVTVATSDARGDVLDDLVVEQRGTAQQMYDLTGATLWADDGTIGFQGIGVDRELTAGEWNANINGWAFRNIHEPVSATGARFFVTVDVGRSPTSNRTVQLRLPMFMDAASNMSYDHGDLGIFLRTATPAPAAVLLNNASLSIRASSVDDQPPLVRITEPKAGSSFEGRNWLLVRGVAQDSGGSSPSRVQVGINRVGHEITWVDATPEVAAFGTWEARFFELPTATQFELRVKGEDWVGNRAAESTPITVELK
ncbi:MAG: hypothetical protein V1723_04980 [Candidatus Uhrbacteria bacterium]